jgi:DNA-binding SARP family transcriptional activator
VEFRVLGPLAVLDDAGQPLRVGGRRGERLVLGVLLLEAGTVVPVHRLVELLWADDPPAGARGIVSTHLSRLRRDLDPDRSGTGVRLENHGDGYRIDVAPEQVDAHRFRRAVQEAREVPDAAGRSRLLGDALALWRGPLLADAVTDDVRDRIGAGWEELRVAAAESLAEADLELGRAADVVPRLTELTEQHPFREGLVALLMTALARGGRVPDALAVYRRTQQRLQDELGLDPGPRLRELHTALLRGGPAAAGRAPVPSQLPRAPRDFVGRERTLRRLDESAATVGAGGPHACLLIGPAGVGKTALALHWVADGGDRFPDGRLYVPLRGSGPAPLPPVAALTHLLRSLGVRPEQVPGDVAEASALYRSVLADRRVVVLLDDAADAAQVRPLLPGAGGSLVLVTSRQRLAGLVALDGALGLPVAPLTAAESGLLLETMLGKEVAADEAAAVRRLADVCDHLPLALRIAAANLGDEPEPVAGYLRRLDEDRLGALRVEGDPVAAVRVAGTPPTRGSPRRSAGCCGWSPSPGWTSRRGRRPRCSTSRPARPARCSTGSPTRTWSRPATTGAGRCTTWCGCTPGSAPRPRTATRTARRHCAGSSTGTAGWPTRSPASCCRRGSCTS